MAKMLVEAYANNALTNEVIDSVDLNLPPGVITKMAQKCGLIDKVNEVILLETINRRLAPKFREIICSGQYLNDKKQDNLTKTLPKTTTKASEIADVSISNIPRSAESIMAENQEIDQHIVA